MTTYYVDDGGSATAPYDTWAKAATSLSALDDAVALATADVVYVGHNHVCQFTHSDNRVLTLSPDGTGPNTRVISATQGSSPAAYAKSSTAQVDTTEGAYILLLMGAASYYGVKMVSGSHIAFTADPGVGGENLFRDCTFAPAANCQAVRAIAVYRPSRFVDCTFDLTADGTSARSEEVFNIHGGKFTFVGATFVNAAYRTGTVVGVGLSSYLQDVALSGCDLSGFTNATACELSGNIYGRVEFANCLTAATWTPHTGNMRAGAELTVTNCGPADAPTYLYMKNGAGDVLSSTAIYRTGGATVEGTAVAWLITTNEWCDEAAPFYTPWRYGYCSGTGSKTFSLYITNDTADFDDDEVWIELDYLGASDEANWTRATDQRATITTTAAAQTDDTASTWNGTGPSFTYKQKLAVTVTVGEEGQYRARVACGVTSLASSRYFYVDPVVTVS